MTKRHMLHYATAIEKALEAAMKGRRLDPCPVCAVDGLTRADCGDCPLTFERLGSDCSIVRACIIDGGSSRPTYIRRVRGIVRKLRAGTWKP